MIRRLARGFAFSAAVLMAAMGSGCSSTGSGEAEQMDTVSQAGSTDGEWRVLFDGTSADAWRGYRQDALPAGWQVIDGTLTRVAGGGDIITRDTFGDFELSLEWMVEPGGNSGIMYRVTEDAEASYMTGIEMQVLDDARHADGKSPLTSAGALYGLYPAPPGAVRPAGEWNQARIVLRNNRVEHWLNGVRIVEAEIGGADWNARVRGSKFAEWPGYGKHARGHIALQDHGDRVAYRNIRIKELS